MIKFTATKDGKPLFGFGLSHGNLRLLKQGRPIVVDLALMGGEGKVMIFAGETEESIVEQMQQAGLIGPDVEIREQEQNHEGSGE